VTIRGAARPGLGPLARRRERWFYLLVAPWLIGFVLFQAGPIVAGMLLTFGEWPIPQAPRWVGLENLQELVADPLFWRTLANTAVYAAGTVVPGLAIGLGLALLVRRPRRGVGAFRLIFFLPVLVSGVATALLWGWLLNPRFGLAEQVLRTLGIDGPAWFFDPAWAMPALILMGLWNAGVTMLVYVAALNAVPGELHDAAAIDGAGRWGRFRHVTWPLITPVTLYLAVVNLVGAFQVFTPIYLLTGGGPDGTTLTLPVYIYQNAFAYGRLGYASALATVLFVVVAALTIILFRFANRRVAELQDGR
jgi:multiple sugar transport system permease protein